MVPAGSDRDHNADTPTTSADPSDGAHPGQQEHVQGHLLLLLYHHLDLCAPSSPFNFPVIPTLVVLLAACVHAGY